MILSSPTTVSRLVNCKNPLKTKKRKEIWSTITNGTSFLSEEDVCGGVRLYYKLPEESGPPKFRTSGTVDVSCAMGMCTQSILTIPPAQKDIYLFDTPCYEKQLFIFTR